MKKVIIENLTDTGCDVLIPGATIKLIIDPISNETTLLLNNEMVLVVSKNLFHGINVSFNLTMLGRAVESLKKQKQN